MKCDLCGKEFEENETRFIICCCEGECYLEECTVMARMCVKCFFKTMKNHIKIKGE